MSSWGNFLRYPTAFCRTIIVIINNIYCIPTYVVWMTILLPLKRVNPGAYYKIEGLFFHWLLAVVAMWSYTAGYEIVEVGDDITLCRNKRTLVVANHQSTADVPLLMANFNAKSDVLPNVMWIMDRLFKYTNFGIVSVIHQDFFIAAGKKNREESILALKDHVLCRFLKRDRKWIVLFPEGGFLHKRRETSQIFAKKNNLPVLEYVTTPRVGAFLVIMEALHIEPKTQSKNTLLDYVLDITIAYPDGNALDLPNIIHGLRKPFRTYMLYRLYKAQDIPVENDALTQWLYDRFIEKNALLESFYKNGNFYEPESSQAHLIQQDILRTIKCYVDLTYPRNIINTKKINSLTNYSSYIKPLPIEVNITVYNLTIPKLIAPEIIDVSLPVSSYIQEEENIIAEQNSISWKQIGHHTISIPQQ